jgi:isocitrate dehydrogenase kinase/phosphatase
VTNTRSWPRRPGSESAGSDIFPEEHQRFLGLSPELADVLLERHGDLFEVEPWKAIQERIEAGELMEVFPYGDESRLPRDRGCQGLVALA